ncbi:hypothetical protein CLOM_g19336 [Closterium sp. NIES-68]|nr:hypothetical protein CLOM_g19336 [Closterium sp. NIES-68]GJP58962.1 hypothetical protein CLOP_g6728 [Closterium sp. NIES-67]
MEGGRRLIALVLLAGLWSTVAATESSSSSSQASDSTSALTANKVGALFVFLASSFLGVFVPYFIPVRQNVLKFGVLFSTGLFIGMSLLYLTPETEELFSELTTNKYPLAYLVVVMGVFLTWLCDLIVKTVWRKRSVSDDPAKESDPTVAGILVGQKVTTEGDEEAAGGAAATDYSTLSFIDVALILFALCFHAVFEGLAVGLASTVYDVWQMGSSIAVNEFFEGLALGVTLRVQDTERSAVKHLLFALCASIVAPLGIAIGIVLDEAGDPTAREWVKAFGNGMAAGVFLFIALGHLIAKGMKPGANDKPWLVFVKWFVAGLGLMTNALLQLIGKS